MAEFLYWKVNYLSFKYPNPSLHKINFQMKTRIFYLILSFPLLFLAPSCSNNTAKADEPEIATMDSVTNELEQSTEKLDEEAKKVEESLEKIEKEF